jgi:hypothetical protein
MPDTRINVAVFPRGITVVEVLTDWFPDSVGGAA